jgi:hypothetical protein
MFGVQRAIGGHPVDTQGRSGLLISVKQRLSYPGCAVG